MLLWCGDVPIALKFMQLGWGCDDGDVSILASTGGPLTGFTG